MYDYTERFTWVNGGACVSEPIEVVDGEFVCDEDEVVVDEIVDDSTSITVYLDIEAAASFGWSIAPGNEAIESEIETEAVGCVYAFATHAYAGSGSVCPLSGRTIDGLALELKLSYYA